MDPFYRVALPGTENVQNYLDADSPFSEFVFSPFRIGRYAEVRIRLKNSLPAAEVVPEILGPRPDEHITSREEYIATVNLAKERFVRNGFSKVVLARNKVIPVPADFNPIAFFNRVCTQYTHAFRYLIWHPDTGLWIGASPELLLEIDEREMHTMALAGTLYDTGRNWTEKEYNEHDIVTRYIADKLTALDLEELDLGERITVQAGNVQHLRTDIRATVAYARADELVNQLHPTPAVAGFPLSESLHFINRHENLERSYYAGFVGLRGQRNLKFFVNLRCMRIYNNALEFFAGAGITADSDPELEWEETERKIDTLASLL